jgi:hypothetical protein
MIFLISASPVARITVVSHQHLVLKLLFIPVYVSVLSVCATPRGLYFIPGG